MKTIETDVLVVGAGPAGSMAARSAALHGARTLLIEKRPEIGSPVRCAEGVSRDLMAECGLDQDPRWIAATPRQARIFAPDGTCATLGAGGAGSEIGLILERQLFDKALAGLAVGAGADLRLKTSATGVTRSGKVVNGIVGKSLGQDVEIRARITIGADGFESQVGRWAGIPTNLKACDVSSCFQYRLANVECDPRCCDFYFGSCAPGGYIWVFPKGRDVANVGIAVQLSRLQGRGDTRRYLDRWIAGQPRFAGGKPLDMVAGALSTNKPLPRTVTAGLMLVGDAARMIDPLTGGGIANACLSGRLAGEVAAQALQAGDVSEAFLQRYERAWRSRLEKKLTRNWLAKEKMTRLDDQTVNSVVAALAKVDLNANTLSLLIAIGKKYPRFPAGLAHLLRRG